MTGAIFPKKTPRRGGGGLSISSLFQLFSGCYLSALMLFAYRMNIIKCLFFPETAQTLKRAYQITHAGPGLGSLFSRRLLTILEQRGLDPCLTHTWVMCSLFPVDGAKRLDWIRSHHVQTETAKPEAAAGGTQRCWARILHPFKGESRGGVWKWL